MPYWSVLWNKIISMLSAKLMECQWMEGMAMCVTFPFLIFNLNISRMKILFWGKLKVSKSLSKSEEIGNGNYCNHKKIIRDTNSKEILESFLFCMYLGSFTLPLLPLYKAKWVQLNDKTLQVLKTSLTNTEYVAQKWNIEIGK